MVFQNYALYPQMTVAQNMGFGLKIRKVPKQEIARRVGDAAKILRLTEYLDRRPKALSGGQRQRVAMGRAIVREPQAFLMDEPLSNLDAQLRVEMRTEIARIQRLLGVATIYVTHDQTEAMTMGDRVAVLRGGVLQQVATPQHLYDHPANEFVAGFIGSPPMNLVLANLDEERANLVLRFGNQTVTLPDSYRQRFKLDPRLGGQVVFGIRPEDLDLADGEGGTRLELTVLLREALGSEVLAYLSYGDDSVIVDDEEGSGNYERRRKRFVARLGARADVREGARVALVMKTENLHFFDPIDGDSLRVTQR
jgi:multiple sugar transport system ATP-binding protein